MLRLVGRDRGDPADEVTRRLGELAASLAHEERLLDELRQSLVRQRGAVAADDPEGIEASVQAIGRTLFTLEEARRRRAALTRHLTGDATEALGELEAHLDRPLPEGFARARRAVREAANAVQREVRINQAVLRRALEAGDAFLQLLFSSTAERVPTYAPAARAPEGRGGLLLDRTG